MIEAPFQIFIGSEPGQFLPAELVRFTLSKSSDALFDIHDLKFQNLPFDVRAFPGFFIHRFAIPSLCNFQGRALYLDATHLIFADLAEAFSLDMNGFGALACSVLPGQPQSGRITGFMLLDCAKLKHWDLPKWVNQIRKDPSAFTQTLKALPGGFVTDDFGDLPEPFRPQDTPSNDTRIVHYTLPSSEIGKEGSALSPFFLQELKCAIQEEAIPLDVLQSEIAHGRVHPNLLNLIT